MVLTPSQVTRFQSAIWAHYRKNKRPMPWRDNLDPYAIVVSEVMLQQTQVRRVWKKFQEFMVAFPDFSALAAAPAKKVLAVWQGLGYNRRALYLRQLAMQVVGTFSGRLPSDVSLLETLPGIGPATARSIAAFAFNLPVVFIETNIRSVYLHHFFPNQQASDAELLPLINQTLPENNPREWYWALMDYGSWLKQKVPNPSRKSIHYTRQPKFAGSNRQKRGQVLRQLLSASRTPEELSARLSLQKRVVTTVLFQLEKEGFVKHTGKKYAII